MPAGCILVISKKQARFISLVLHLIVLPFSTHFWFFCFIRFLLCLLPSDFWYTENSTECLSNFLNTAITFQNSAADATTLYVSSFSSLLLFLSLFFSLLDYFPFAQPDRRVGRHAVPMRGRLLYDGGQVGCQPGLAVLARILLHSGFAEPHAVRVRGRHVLSGHLANGEWQWRLPRWVLLPFGSGSAAVVRGGFLFSALFLRVQCISFGNRLA